MEAKYFYFPLLKKCTWSIIHSEIANLPSRHLVFISIVLYFVSLHALLTRAYFYFFHCNSLFNICLVIHILSNIYFFNLHLTQRNHEEIFTHSGQHHSCSMLQDCWESMWSLLIHTYVSQHWADNLSLNCASLVLPTHRLNRVSSEKRV